MVKKIFKTIFRIVIFILVYLIQIYIVNNTTFFGINGDLCLMAVALIALMDNNLTSYITATLCGITSDLLFAPSSIKYIVIYILVTAVLIELKKMYKQDNQMSVIIFSVIATIISEIIMFIFMVITKTQFINIFSYIFNIFKECAVNICLAYVLYLALRLTKQEG